MRENRHQEENNKKTHFTLGKSDNILSTNINYQRKNFQTITQSKYENKHHTHTYVFI